MKVNFFNKLFGNSSVSGDLAVTGNVSAPTFNGMPLPSIPIPISLAHYSYNHNTNGASKSVNLYTFSDSYDSPGFAPVPFLLNVDLSITYLASAGVVATEIRQYGVYCQPAFSGTYPTVNKIFSDLLVITPGYSTGVSLSGASGILTLTLGGSTTDDELQVVVTIR